VSSVPKRRGEVYTGFWCGNVRGKKLGKPRLKREDNIKLDLQEMGCGIWTASVWLRIGTGGGHM
jgi:hypothetical protein